MNDEISNNVINISHDSQYRRWSVNGESSNTFGTLELLFPISKKDRSCFVLKMIILVTFQKGSFLFCSKKDCSCVPNRIVLVSFQKGSFLFHSEKDCLFLASLWLV